MRQAALLYNPLSGRQRKRRLAVIEEVAGILRAAGIEIISEPTRGAAESGQQAKQAVAGGCDTVLACGGDGTVHDILQGIVGTQAALGVIPLGTANSLAHDLHIPMNPVAAAKATLRGKPRGFAVGRLEYQDFGSQRASRYFTVAVGVGIDAHLFYKLNAAIKQQFGMGSYYAKAIRLWCTHKMEFFDVELPDSRMAAVSELLAVRIGDFGGLLRELAPGAALANDQMRLVLFRTGNRFRYLQYILRGLLRQEWSVPGIELHDAARVVCKPRNARIFVEADGELVGT
ncbi:MAG TPA: diacylglycerol kinase family protein, partial [Terriglobales bacterium]